jgi:formylglycine-generating enzyme required for sulfatase activity
MITNRKRKHGWCLSRLLACGVGLIPSLAVAAGPDRPAPPPPSETPIPVVAGAAEAQAALDKALASGQALVADLTCSDPKSIPAKCRMVLAKAAEPLPPGRYRLHALVGSTAHDTIIGEGILLWMSVQGSGKGFDRPYFFPKPGKLMPVWFDFTLEKPDAVTVNVEWVVSESASAGFGSPDDKRKAYDDNRWKFIDDYFAREAVKSLKGGPNASLDDPALDDDGLGEALDEPQAKATPRLTPRAVSAADLPAHRIMLTGLVIERMAPVAVVAVQTDPEIYKLGGTGRVMVDVRNLAAAPVTTKLAWTVGQPKKTSDSPARHEETVTLAAGEQRSVALAEPLTTTGITGGLGLVRVEAMVESLRPSVGEARFIVSSLEGGKPGESRTFATDIGLAMQWCPPGEFLMGSESGDADEKPVHRVRLTNGFWIGRTEVTQQQWEAVLGTLAERITNPSKFNGPDLPVERVGLVPPGAFSFRHSAVFCRKLTERERAAGRLQEGFSYRIPTEAQWEYACRAGSTGDYAGDLDAMAWYQANSGGKTQPVAQKKPNAWGLHDMHGNVWEWCMSAYGDYPSGLVVDPDREVADQGVIRGGSWRSSAAYCRSALRERADIDSAIGFRVILCADEVAARPPAAPAPGNDPADGKEGNVRAN